MNVRALPGPYTRFTGFWKRVCLAYFYCLSGLFLDVLHQYNASCNVGVADSSLLCGLLLPGEIPYQVKPLSAAASLFLSTLFLSFLPQSAPEVPVQFGELGGVLRRRVGNSKVNGSNWEALTHFLNRLRAESHTKGPPKES